MICEDEGLTVLRLKKALSSLGYEVVGEAKNGEEAVALAEQLRPDAILMDIRMPKLDGIAATERIMSARPTAIVMITAYSDRELVEAALQAGASGYLVKPVSDEQIEPALGGQQWRRILHLREGARIETLAEHQVTRAELLGGFDLAFSSVPREHRWDFPAAPLGEIRDCRQRGLGTAEAEYQLAIGDGPDPRRADQA